jgi:oxygen-independent coproporphyrinogen-3 oxidase
MNLSVEALMRHRQQGPRYTSYPPANWFEAGLDWDARLRQRLHWLAVSGQPVSLYLHLPFCAQRCHYCACNAVAAPQPARVSWFLPRLLDEIDLWYRETGRIRVHRIHLGGGTPTYHAADELQTLLDHLHRRFDLHLKEGSVEVDPRVTTLGQLRVLRDFGMDRISLGVQDLDPEVQQRIGRVQPLDMVARTMEEARGLGFTSINLDLIYGLPGQTPDTLRSTLHDVVALAPDRLALYGFAWVPGLFAGQKRMDPSDMPDEPTRAALLLLAREFLLTQGYESIGIDHFARPGDGLARALHQGNLYRDFMGYTDRPPGHLLGMGPSAISHVEGLWVQNARKIADWLEDLEGGRLPSERGWVMRPDDERRAQVISELMCRGEVDKARFQAQFGEDFDLYFRESLQAVNAECADLVDRNDGRTLRLNPLGRLLGRAVAMRFDALRAAGRGTYSAVV